MRGVKEHTEQTIPVYRKLYPPEDIVRRIACELYANLKNIKGNMDAWKILNIGIGGGWITIEFLKSLLEDEDSSKPHRVSFTGIDASDAMLVDFKENLKKEFTVVEEGQKIKIENDRNLVFEIELNKKNFLQSEELKEDHFDIYFSFFFIHHLNSHWKQGIDKISKSLKENGVIVIAEIVGDHACWSYSFDKVYDFFELTENTQRLKYLTFIKKSLLLFEKEYDYSNYGVISASNMNPAFDYLEENNFKRLDKMVQENYTIKFTINDWINAVEERIYSVFPEVKGNKKQLMRKLRGIAEDIGIDVDECIKAKDDIDLSFFQKRK